MSARANSRSCNIASCRGPSSKEEHGHRDGVSWVTSSLTVSRHDPNCQDSSSTRWSGRWIDGVYLFEVEARQHLARLGRRLVVEREGEVDAPVVREDADLTARSNATAGAFAVDQPKQIGMMFLTPRERASGGFSFRSARLALRASVHTCGAACRCEHRRPRSRLGR